MLIGGIRDVELHATIRIIKQYQAGSLHRQGGEETTKARMAVGLPGPRLELSNDLKVVSGDAMFGVVRLETGSMWIVAVFYETLQSPHLKSNLQHLSLPQLDSLGNPEHTRTLVLCLITFLCRLLALNWAKRY